MAADAGRRSPPGATVPRRPGAALLALLALGAVGIGLAAALLPHAASASPGGGPGTLSGELTIGTAAEIIGILAAGLVLLYLYISLAGPGGAVPKRFLSVLLAYLLVSLAFIGAVHLAYPGNAFNSPSGLPQNSTGGGTPGQPGNASTNLTNISRAPFAAPPPWLWWAVGAVLLVGLVAAASAILLVGRGRTEALAAGGSAAHRLVGMELRNALDRLAGSSDPREVLIALYGQLLRQVSGSLPQIDAATPREIERACVEQLGIPAEPAFELRQLFERARYSTLPMDRSDVDRARSALQAALGGLRPREP